MSIREVMDFENYDKIFRGGKVEKKKMNRAEKVKQRISVLTKKVNDIFEGRGYSPGDEMLTVNLVELIMDCENAVEDKLIKEAMKKLLK